jgi:flagellar hook-length control protein FliK
MSRLSLDAATGFFSVELVTSAIVPPAGGAGQAPSFDRYLQQATAAAHQTTETDRSPLPPSRSEAKDDGPCPIDPQSSQESRSTATEPASDSAGQAGPSGPASEAESEPRAPDPEAVSDEPTEPNEEEEDEDEQSATDSARPVAALDVEALVEAGNPESSPGDSAASDTEGVAHEGQGEASEPTQQKLTPAATGELPPGNSEKSGSVDTQKSASIDAETEAAEESSAQRNGSAVEAVKLQEGETPDNGGARPSDGSDKVGHNGGDAASETSHAPGLGTAVVSSQGQASPADSRQQHRSTRVGDRPGDDPRAEQGTSTETAPAEQRPKMALPVEAPNGLESDGGEETTTGPISTETGEGEAGPPARAWANQGSQQASTARGPEPSGPDQADRVRFVQRVARAFEAMGERGGSVRLRLHPPELGSLRLEVTLRNGTMTARLEVESDSARTMLLDNLPALRDRLAQQEIKVDRFDVDVGDRSPGGTPQGPGDHPQPHDHSRLDSAKPGSEQETEAERAPEPRAVGQPDQGNQLDVVV